MRPASPRELARFIDHTLLRPEATRRDIETLCAQALQSGFHAVCVHGSRVPLARQCLAGSPVGIAAVVGFPHGASATRAKLCETETALRDGASEIDAVIALGQLKEGARDHVLRELRDLVQTAGPAPVKIILECGLLTREEKIIACQLCTEAGVAMVKTSTGFGPGGATREDVQLLRDMVPRRMGVKASGGIREVATALELLDAGATRLGTSSGPALLAALLQGGTPSTGD